MSQNLINVIYKVALLPGDIGQVIYLKWKLSSFLVQPNVCDYFACLWVIDGASVNVCCVCVWGGGRADIHKERSVCVGTCVYVCLYVFVCVCVSSNIWRR